MRAIRLILLAALLPARALAQPSIARAIHTGDWATADQLARQDPNPLATKIVLYERLLAPGEATAEAIGAFVAANPSWPEPGVLRRRLAEATAATADDQQARLVCDTYKPTIDVALLRCARAVRAGGDEAQAHSLARQAWVAGLANPAAEAAFLRELSPALDADTEWRRFDALAWTNSPEAGWQAARVDPSQQALALARVALRRNDSDAATRLAAVPPAQANDPILLLEQARWLRVRGDTAGALALWRGQLAVAETNAPPERRAAFWSERERLARLLLTVNDSAGAYFLADDAHVPTEQVPDAEFLAGWIALRKLRDPSSATAHFRALAKSSPAAITQGRAYYWLGRAAQDPDAAKTALAKAADFPTTWFGQLAAATLDGSVAPRIEALRDPPILAAAQARFSSSELIHAADLLAAWGDTPDARPFLIHEAKTNPDVSTYILVARKALEFGLPDVAIQVARYSARLGKPLPHLGWPAPFAPPPGADAPLALGLMRQESSFDSGIVSHAGAIGLMQLLPGTAHQFDTALTDPAAMLADPDVNMRIGTEYLRTLLQRFGGIRAYALAAYNAGPHRVRTWIDLNGDAAATNDPNQLIDWIEQIPYAETRNYVERVLESTEIYQVYAAQ